MESQHLGKCLHLIFLYIIGHNNKYFMETPRPPNPKIWEITTRIDADLFVCLLARLPISLMLIYINLAIH